MTHSTPRTLFPVGILLFLVLALGIQGWSVRADSESTTLDGTAELLVGTMLAHCEVPCGIYDDHAMVKQMLLDAETISKASAQIQLLAAKVDATSLNTISRWVMVKEEHSRNLQHVNAWYFMTQRVKAVPSTDPGYADYLGRLAAHHAISVNAMKAAQSLDRSAQSALRSSIEAVAPWYPPNPDGASSESSLIEQWKSVAVRD